MNDWKRNLKKEEKRRELRSEKEGRKKELEKFRKAEVKLNKAKNKDNISNMVKGDIETTAKAIRHIAGKLKRNSK